jgi:hypothetical protein
MTDKREIILPAETVKLLQQINNESVQAANKAAFEAAQPYANQMNGITKLILQQNDATEGQWRFSDPNTLDKLVRVDAPPTSDGQPNISQRHPGAKKTNRKR